MKKIFLLLILNEFLSNSAFCQTDTLYDIFPLQTNLLYRYNYDRNYYYHGTNVIETDSGSIDLIVRNSSAIGDTLRLWTIEERNHLSLRIIIASYLDTLITQNDTIFFTISESLIGNHLLNFPEIIIFQIYFFVDWGSHSPWSKISIERYSSEPNVIQVINHYPGSLFGDDTLKYFQLMGLNYRSWDTEWVGTGFWHSYLTVQQIGEPVLEILNESGFPSTTNLYQNYPNPFNPTTTIKYQIPEISFVTIKVFDILGREVATLVNDEKPAGNYEVQFSSHSVEGRSLTSGIYFYQLKAGDYSETKKMILLK
jgi:hypothetical protein